MSGSFPSPNDVFQERYRIVSIINRGGFGRVYRASQLELNRDVAIKVLQPIRRDEMDADEEAKRLAIVQRRFEREAQLVCQLRDSHTVVMHDFGTTPAGLLYMVLEYIDGRPLNQVVEEDGPLSPERVVKIARQALWSLQEAHALNMLHRDVKPQNIMLFDHAGRTDQVKVLDFGLAKSAESAEFRAEDPDLTGEEVILGTPRYMSPEQIRGEPLDPSSDIYSLGLVMFEMLSGYKAVVGDSTMTTLARHLNDQPFLLPADLEIPNSLREIVERMMSKDRDRRIRTSEEVLEALEFWNSNSSVLGGGPSDPLAEPALLGERRKRTAIWALGAAMTLFLVFAIAVAATRDDPQAAVIDELEQESANTGTPERDGVGVRPKLPDEKEKANPVRPPTELVAVEVEPEKRIPDDLPTGEVVVVEPDPTEEPGIEPDAGDIMVLEETDMGPAEVPPEPEEVVADPPQPKRNGSTNSSKSGNKKKNNNTGLNIGILN